MFSVLDLVQMHSISKRSMRKYYSLKPDITAQDEMDGTCVIAIKTNGGMEIKQNLKVISGTLVVIKNNLC